MKSAKFVFKQQIEAILQRANSLVSDVSESADTPQALERCHQVMQLLTFAKQALEDGNLGGAMGVAQDAETEANRLHKDIFKGDVAAKPKPPPKEVRERTPKPAKKAVPPEPPPEETEEEERSFSDNGPGTQTTSFSLQEAAKEALDGVLAEMEEMQAGEKTIDSLEQVESTISNVRTMLTELAQASDGDEQFERCMEIKSILRKAEDSLSKGPIEEALRLAQEAQREAGEFRSLLLEEGNEEQRKDTLKETLSQLQKDYSALEESEGLLKEELGTLADAAQNYVEEGKLKEAEAVADKMKSLLDAFKEEREDASTPRQAAPAFVPEEEPQAAEEEEAPQAIVPEEEPQAAEEEEAPQAVVPEEEPQAAEEEEAPQAVVPEEEPSAVYAAGKDPQVLRREILLRIRDEWVIDLSDDVMSFLVENVETANENELAELLQQMVSRSLLTREAITVETARETLQGLE